MAAIRKMEIDRDTGSFAIRPSNYVDAKALAANTAESFTVPEGPTSGKKANYAVFSATADFYVHTTTTATVPGDTADGTASTLNPTVYLLDGDVDTISVISAATCIVTVSYYM